MGFRLNFPPFGNGVPPTPRVFWLGQILFTVSGWLPFDRLISVAARGGHVTCPKVPIMLDPHLGTVFFCFGKFFFTNFKPNSNQIYFNFKFRIADVWFGVLWADLRGRSRIGLLLCAVSACSLLVLWRAGSLDHRPGARSGDTRYMCILRRKPI